MQVEIRMQGSSINSYQPVYRSNLSMSEPVNNIAGVQPALPPVILPNGSAYVKSYVFPQIVYPQKPESLSNIPGVKDPVILEALNKLREVRYLPGDAEYIRNMGLKTIYNNGQEAINMLISKNLKVEFGQVSDPAIHAQWINSENKVIINEKYKDTKDPAVIMAISEAIFHELGHAKDGDELSSIQEELECLALNTLAYRYHRAYYPDAFKSAANADIINNGVSLYEKLFFDPDIEKKGLVNRVIDKYGSLPLESPNHSLPIAALVEKRLANVNESS